MDGLSLLQIGSCLAFIIFIIAFIGKTIRYATAPLHLRWELYPVPHEKGREYGGSYFEELEWWTKPRKKNLFREFTFMMEEILFLKEYYHRNRGFWYFVYPFHVGVYLFVAWLVLLLIGALSMLGGVSVSAGSTNPWGQVLYYLTLIVGIASLIIGTVGCIGLLIKRTTNEDLKLYTAPIDYFNLSFVLAIFVSGLCAWLFFDPTFATAREYMKSLITFSPMNRMNPALMSHIIIVSLFLIYMPFTRMMHYLAKYFTFHKVRWEDEPNLRGSKIEKRVILLLDQTVSWSAPHIQSGKRWSEVASEEVK
jgi:nitrate reductase gamma subunit